MEYLMPKTGFLSYMGGKTYIADWIINKFPSHSTYVDVFGGGASIIFAKEPSLVEIYNDKWGEIVHLFLTLRDHSKELQEYLKYTPASRDLYSVYFEKYENKDYKDDIEKTGLIFYLLRCSRNSMVNKGNWKVAATRMPARQIKQVTDNLFEFVERFRNVNIENLDFRDCITKFDSEETLFYCDPPYLHLNHYQLKFKYRDHYQLAKLLGDIKGKVAISYYPKDSIYDLYPEDKWFFSEIEVTKYSNVIKSGKKQKEIELLITNYEPLEYKISKSKNLMELGE